MNKYIFNVTAICVTLFFSTVTNAIVATDLSALSLGAKIVGPVGPDVETTLTFNDTGGNLVGVADLSSSVSCDARFANNCSATEVSGFSDVIYTYQHQIIPGKDLPNDLPFLTPDIVVPFNGVTEFRMQFPAHGFNGVAGFDFSQVNAAIGNTNIEIEQLADGSLVWILPSGSGWDTNESITFFWQTTQRPSGPGGVYAATNQTLSGAGNGPIPEPVAISEPTIGLLLLMGLFALSGQCRNKINRYD